MPSAEDVRACVKDLDALYKAMPADRRLAEAAEVTHNPATAPPANFPLAQPQWITDALSKPTVPPA